MITDFILRALFLGKWNLYGHASMGSLAVFLVSEVVPLYAGFLVGVLIMFFKELFDYKLDEYFDCMALLYGWAGVLLTTVLLIITRTI